ncbi:hypothetical protein [Lysinibacillus xylanilyticus]|uniref:Uncharacterized protein n=1 Tax=Lysinibacillus xylanilyticus TaxID=582475 RepID=A0ABT4ELF8_9BACI|nr:hypothetical protein [Lysinibacillus xylanilyticus]MCY9546510.1 hypothetical protein [Lysinibacillus xylanilyticus]
MITIKTLSINSVTIATFYNHKKSPACCSRGDNPHILFHNCSIWRAIHDLGGAIHHFDGSIHDFGFLSVAFALLSVTLALLSAALVFLSVTSPFLSVALISIRRFALSFRRFCLSFRHLGSSTPLSTPIKTKKRPPK